MEGYSTRLADGSGPGDGADIKEDACERVKDCCEGVEYPSMRV
jgi:hypothetical protein